jgi:hypothetical protein
MLAVLVEFRRFMKRAWAAGDDRWRGHLPDASHDDRVQPLRAQDEHAQWLGFADSPECLETVRGDRDGLA